MTYEADFRNYLVNHADATALRALVTEIYWFRLPQGPTYPSIRIHTVTSEPGWILSGDDGWQTTTLQLSIFDQAHATCVSIREALRSLLHGAIFSYGSTDFKSVRFINSNEYWLTDAPEGYVHMPCDFRLMHRDTP